MSTPTNPPASRAREDETISFVRWRLFAAFTVMAWASLFKPRLGLEMIADAGDGAAERCRRASLDRIFSQTRRGKVSVAELDREKGG